MSSWSPGQITLTIVLVTTVIVLVFTVLTLVKVDAIDTLDSDEPNTVQLTTLRTLTTDSATGLWSRQEPLGRILESDPTVLVLGNDAYGSPLPVTGPRLDLSPGGAERLLTYNPTTRQVTQTPLDNVMVERVEPALMVLTPTDVAASWDGERFRRVPCPVTGALQAIAYLTHCWIVTDTSPTVYMGNNAEAFFRVNFTATANTVVLTNQAQSVAVFLGPHAGQTRYYQFMTTIPQARTQAVSTTRWTTGGIMDAGPNGNQGLFSTTTGGTSNLIRTTCDLDETPAILTVPDPPADITGLAAGTPPSEIVLVLDGTLRPYLSSDTGDSFTLATATPPFTLQQPTHVGANQFLAFDATGQVCRFDKTADAFAGPWTLPAPAGTVIATPPAAVAHLDGHVLVLFPSFYLRSPNPLDPTPTWSVTTPTGFVWSNALAMAWSRPLQRWG